MPHQIRRFEDKLKDDLRRLVFEFRCNMILLQEVSVHWAERIGQFSPLGWGVKAGRKCKCVIMYEPHRYSLDAIAEVPIFPRAPQSDCPYRGWRRFLQALVGRTMVAKGSAVRGGHSQDKLLPKTRHWCEQSHPNPRTLDPKPKTLMRTGTADLVANYRSDRRF